MEGKKRRGTYGEGGQETGVKGKGRRGDGRWSKRGKEGAKKGGREGREGMKGEERRGKASTCGMKNFAENANFTIY